MAKKKPCFDCAEQVEQLLDDIEKYGKDLRVQVIKENRDDAIFYREYWLESDADGFMPTPQPKENEEVVEIGANALLVIYTVESLII